MKGRILFAATSVLLAWPLSATEHIHAFSSSHHTYVNRVLDLAFEYPSSLRISNSVDPGQDPDKPFVTFGTLIGGDLHDEETIHFCLFFRDRPMTMSLLEREYAPLGLSVTAPERRTYGGNHVFFYGQGGGGVFYPDQFFLPRGSRFVIFAFYGPGDINQVPLLKSPGAATRRVEAQVLSSIRSAP